MDPIGILGAYLAVTADLDRAEKRRQAALGALTAAGFLIGFTLLGHWLLGFFRISLSAVEAVGGLLVGSVGWRMATRPLQPPEREEPQNDSLFLHPIAFPLLAGPGALAVLLSLSSRSDSWLDFPGFVLGCLGICLVAFTTMSLAAPISKRLGPHGIEIIVRIMGLVVLAVAAELVFHGIADHFGLEVSD